MNSNPSEIARFRELIEIEHQAMIWAREGLSEGSIKHAFIDRRQRHMDIAYDGLRKIVGDEEAIKVVYEVWETTPDKSHPEQKH